MSTLSYKANAGESLERLGRLYSRQAMDRVLVAFDNPSPTLEAFGRAHVAGSCPCPDPAERIVFWDSVIRERSIVEDDSIPSAYLSELDQGLYAGLLDGDVQFMCNPDTGWISSMVAPLFDRLQDFKMGELNPAHPWMRRFTDQLRIFAEHAEGKFGISHLILIDSLNFVFELVGATKTYEALIDEPDLVRHITDFAFTLNVDIHSRFFEMAPDIRGGTCCAMGQWLPGHIVSESVDPFHMTSVDYFEEWGREPVERIFARFDGGIVHLHGNGRHLLESAATLKGLKAILLGDDRGFPLAFDVVEEVRRRAGDVPLVLTAELDSFVRRLESHELAGGTLYLVRNDRGPVAANALMDKAREYRV